jgi:hypothetical protein
MQDAKTFWDSQLDATIEQCRSGGADHRPSDEHSRSLTINGHYMASNEGDSFGGSNGSRFYGHAVSGAVSDVVGMSVEGNVLEISNWADGFKVEQSARSLRITFGSEPSEADDFGVFEIQSALAYLGCIIMASTKVTPGKPLVIASAIDMLELCNEREMDSFEEPHAPVDVEEVQKEGAAFF